MPTVGQGRSKAASALCIQIAHRSALLPGFHWKPLDHCIHSTHSNGLHRPRVGAWPCNQTHHGLHGSSPSSAVHLCQHWCLLNQLLVGEGLKKAAVWINLSLQSALTVTSLNTQHPTQLSRQAQAYCILGGRKLMSQKGIYLMI